MKTVSQFAAPTLVNDAKQILLPDDLLDYTLIHDRHDSWPRWFSENKLQTQTASISNAKNFIVHDAFQAIELVRGGFGVGLFDRNDVMHELHKGSLVSVLDQGVLAKDWVYLLVQAADQQTLRARLFQDYLTNYLVERGINLDIPNPAASQSR